MRSAHARRRDDHQQRVVRGHGDAGASATAYGGTKAAVVSMTRAAALALADQGIDVIAISPWIVDTPMS